MTPPVRKSSDTFVTAYEALRTHMLTGAMASHSEGLVVLLRQGAAAWMTHVSAFSHSLPAITVEKPLVGGPNQSALVKALANMALSARKEMRV